jgi:xylitol oxidase
VLTNWAGNITFTPQTLAQPESVEELRRVVAGADRVRALGTGHSFNRIADTDGTLVSVARLPAVVDIDETGSRARVSAGMRYGEVFLALQARGLALPNTGSLPHISVAGATATGTHGSGRTNPILGRSIRALTMVAPDGELVRLDRDSEPDFDGCVLSLGRLGIVTEVEVDVVPTYDVAQTVLVDITDDALAEHLPEVLSAAYSVSVFSALVPDRNRAWRKARVGDPDRLADRAWGGSAATSPQHPIEGEPTDSATEQLGRVGPWHERMPHFRMDFVPSRGDELQSEYLMPLEHAGAAWTALLALREPVRRVLLTTEIRAVAGDPMWLSPTGGVDSVAFHFTWSLEPDAVAAVLELIEGAFAPYGARPHWGKVSRLPAADLRAAYPRIADFRDLVARFDPDGRFGNTLVDGWLGLG